MPADRKTLEARRTAILEILKDETHTIEQQADLVQRLHDRGIQATQSSVSRDLQALGVIRVQGHYEVPEWALLDEPSPFDKVARFLQWVKPINPCHVLLVTHPGAGPLVAQALEDCEWGSVLGSVAGVNSVLVLCDNTLEQRIFYERLKQYKPEDGEG